MLSRGLFVGPSLGFFSYQCLVLRLAFSERNDVGHEWLCGDGDVE
jgi:hypothetical protein